MRQLAAGLIVGLIMLAGITGAQERLLLAQAQPVDANAPISPSGARKPSRLEMLALFGDVFERLRTDYIEKPDDSKLLAAALEAIRKQVPTIESSAVSGTPPSSAKMDVYAHLNAFGDAVEKVLDKPGFIVDEASVWEAAIHGMLAALDPNSSYMNAVKFRELRNPGGAIGLDLALVQGHVRVVSALDESPAAKAGIQANDIITHVDEDPVEGLTLAEAAAKLRGPVDTRIRLSLVRRGRDKPIEIVMQREAVQNPQVRSRLEGDVGYIRIGQFNERTTEGIRKAVGDVKARIADASLKGYVIDLRNNPGGLLDQAISVTDAFLERGEIVSTRGRSADETQRFNARAGDLTGGKPIVVLINGGSAAASEVVAGALQDHRRATLVGTRSFGRGSVQTIIPLGAGKGALRLTTSRLVLPLGNVIEGRGIMPDVEVLQEAADEARPATGIPADSERRGPADRPGAPQSYVPSDSKDDKALRKALELLRVGR